MFLDLHAHYPMHVQPLARRGTHAQLERWRRAWLRAQVVKLLSRFANYQGPGDQPGVTLDLMRQGDVGVIFSALYCPFDEIDLTQRYGAKPQRAYFDDLCEQLEDVESDIAAHAVHFPVVIAHSRAELDTALNEGKQVLIHSVEGGFHLGGSEQEVTANVAELARLGVVCITVAHLFWRGVATNAPALPFMSDWLYEHVFCQPRRTGLTALGRALVTAMADNGILIDVTHMSDAARVQTLQLLDDHAPGTPVVATHMANRLGKLEYNLSEQDVKSITDRGGVLGLIACEHYISDGRDKPQSFHDSFKLLCEHIDRICEIAGNDDHVAFGTDLDGYIKPALPGLEHLGRMHRLQSALADKYGAVSAEKFSSANALRLIRAVWR